MGKMTRAGLNSLTLLTAVAYVAMFGMLPCPLCAAAEEVTARSPAEQAIFAALDRKVSLNYSETELKEVAEQLRTNEKINVLLDAKALDEAGLSPDAPITFSEEDLTLRSALREMLSPLDLTITVRNGILWITTPDKAAETLTTRAYDVADLAFAADTATDNAALMDYNSLIEVITNTVGPNTWDEVGGPGSIRAFDGGSLAVSQTDDLHDQIVGLLAALREARNRQAEGPATDGIPGQAGAEAAATIKISLILRQPVSVAWNEVQLQQLVETLHNQYHLPVLIDQKALDEAGLAPDAMLSFTASDISLEDALSAALPSLSLTHVIKNESLVITTPDKAADILQVVIYPVSDLTQRGEHDQANADPGAGQGVAGCSHRDKSKASDGFPDYEGLIETITTTVGPTTWEEVGGPGSIREFENSNTHVLVVSQTAEVQHEIVKLLADLRALRERQRGEFERVDAKRANLRKQPRMEVYFLQTKTPDGDDISMGGLAGLIKKTIAPKTWETDDRSIDVLADRLIVNSTPDVQKQVLDMLRKLQLSRTGVQPPNNMRGGMMGGMSAGGMGGMGMGGMGGGMGGMGMGGMGGPAPAGGGPAK